MTRSDAPGADLVISPPPELVLDVQNLDVTLQTYGSRTQIVRDVSFQVYKGQTIGIIGESGAGKSLMAKALIGLLPMRISSSGQVLLGGRNLIDLSQRDIRQYRGKDIGYVPQDPTRSLDPTMRIGKQIVEAVCAHEELSKQDAKDRAVELMQSVRLPQPKERFFAYPHQLSGGMRQRVVIAMAIASRPRLLIADESTTALDVTTQAEIMNLLQDLQDVSGMSLLMISHDMALAASYTDRILVMYAGRIVEDAATASLFDEVRMPYTQALIDAVPGLQKRANSKLEVSARLTNESSILVSGCDFSSRCDYVRAECLVARPELTGDREHRWACFFPLAQQDATIARSSSASGN